MFIRLTGLNFPTSLSSSFPGFTMGSITDRFHCFGKCPFLKHSLYISVKTKEAGKDDENRNIIYDRIPISTIANKGRRGQKMASEMGKGTKWSVM